jgi:hypothetical protein
MLSEPPGADPHAGWCGRGQGEPGLYPIRCGGGRKPGPVGPARAAQSGRLSPTLQKLVRYETAAGSKLRARPRRPRCGCLLAALAGPVAGLTSHSPGVARCVPCPRRDPEFSGPSNCTCERTRRADANAGYEPRGRRRQAAPQPVGVGQRDRSVAAVSALYPSQKGNAIVRSLEGRSAAWTNGAIRVSRTADIRRDFSSSPEPSGRFSGVPRARQVVWRGLSTAWAAVNDPARRLTSVSRAPRVAIGIDDFRPEPSSERCERLTLGMVSCISAVAGCSFHYHPAQRRKR